MGGHAPRGAPAGRAAELSPVTRPDGVLPRDTCGPAGHQEDPHDRLPGRREGKDTALSLPLALICRHFRLTRFQVSKFKKKEIEIKFFEGCAEFFLPGMKG